MLTCPRLTGVEVTLGKTYTWGKDESNWGLRGGADEEDNQPQALR